MKRIESKQGFTLIELLVVISIIFILAAILYPVFQSVREKARQTQCQAHLQQLALALRQYRTDFGYYPPAPIYNADINRYIGGFSSLFPDYLTDKRVLVCPDDRQIDGYEKEAQDRGYSSYNGYVADPATSWDFKADSDEWSTEFHKADDPATVITGSARYYNYYGYCQEGLDPYLDTDFPYMGVAGVPTWLSNDGLRWRHYPRLSNREAPDNTYITHCVHHRQHYKRATDQMDIYATVGGRTKVVSRMSMEQQTGGVSKWVSQGE